MQKNIDRRSFVSGIAALGAVTVASFPSPSISAGLKEWKMFSSWQKVMPGLGTSSVRLAERITKMSDGRLKVVVQDNYASGRDIFDAVSKGMAEMGYSSPHYWLGTNKALAFFGGVPGGLVAQEQNGWLHFGGGKKLWEELYSQFNLIPFAVGNTGTQMGGWFNREIKSENDFPGLKMRISGFGAEVMRRLGANVKQIEAEDLFTSMQSGIIDALEFIGPWNDMSLGFHRISKYYYGPGFHDGGATVELMVNRKEFDSLPADLKQIVEAACLAENNLVLAEYHANNIKAFQTLKNSYNVDIRKYPDNVMKKLLQLSGQVVSEIAREGDLEKRVYESFQSYRKYSIEMTPYAELGFMQAR